MAADGKMYQGIVLVAVSTIKVKYSNKSITTEVTNQIVPKNSLLFTFLTVKKYAAAKGIIWVIIPAVAGKNPMNNNR